VVPHPPIASRLTSGWRVAFGDRRHMLNGSGPRYVGLTYRDVTRSMPIAASRSGNARTMDRDHDHEITGLLLAWRAGDRGALDRLFPQIYDALHRIAHRQLSHERPGHTLSTTDLVHETYFKLVDHVRVDWTDRAHFFAVAARAMRLILVDQARRRDANKRGGERKRVSLTDSTLTIDERAETLIALDEALTELAKIEERMSQVVECRFFGGLTEEETAEALGVTARTVRRDWFKAKGWLERALRD